MELTLEQRKNQLLKLIQENFTVINMQLLEDTLNQLNEERIILLYKLLDFILFVSIVKKVLCLIEIHENKENLPNLIIAFYPLKEINDIEKFEKDLISNVENYMWNLDKENLLWFVDITFITLKYSNNDKIQKFFQKIQKFNIEVGNKNLLANLITKIRTKEVDALCELIEYLKSEKAHKSLQQFSLEVYKPYDKNYLEILYFVFSLDSDSPSYITDEMLPSIFNYLFLKQPSLQSFVVFVKTKNLNNKYCILNI